MENVHSYLVLIEKGKKILISCLLVQFSDKTRCSTNFYLEYHKVYVAVSDQANLDDKGEKESRSFSTPTRSTILVQPLHI